MKHPTMKNHFLTIATFILTATHALAEPTHYISDKLHAPLRAEQGEKAKILHSGLESGTPVELLEKNDKTGYARIRTGENLEGWVRLQFLSEVPTASMQLEQASAAISELQSKNAALEQELTSIKQIASSQIDIHERNTVLVEQNQLLSNEKEVLKADNDRLKERNDQTWFLYGGILVVLSALTAALIPRIVRRRRNDGWR